MNKKELSEARSYKVVKSNSLIRQARYDLSLSELKAFAFIASRVKPNDKAFGTYRFSINEYCQILGIDTNNGKNIQTVKSSLKGLVDKSFYMKLDNGAETTISWLNKVWIDRGDGRITVRLDEDMLQFITGLYRNFSAYELISVLPMRSAYSIRLYEALKAYAYDGQYTFDVEELKNYLGCKHYTRFPDFRRKVIEVAISEINKFTDLSASWQPETHGRKVVRVTFYVEQRDAWERLEAATRATDQLDGQMSIFDFLEE